MNDDLKDLILSTFETSLDAQLRAVRRLRHRDTDTARPARKKGLSQVDMAYDVLKKTRSTSPRSWPVSRPPSASPSIATAWSLR